MNGLEAIRQIRELETRTPQLATRTPIIALTALVMPGDHERCLDAGANAYLSKPVSLGELSEIVEELLSNYRYEAIS